MRNIHIVENTEKKFSVTLGTEDQPVEEAHIYQTAEELITGLSEIIREELGEEKSIPEKEAPKETYTTSVMPPPAAPVIMRTEPTPTTQPKPSIVDENPPMPYSKQPAPNQVDYNVMTPGGQPKPSNTK